MPGFRDTGFARGYGFRSYDWGSDWGYAGLGFGLGAVALAVADYGTWWAPPAYVEPPPIYFGPPPIVLGLPQIVPAPPILAAAEAPAFDAGPLIGAAMPPPVVLLPPPAEVVEGGPPPPIVTSPDSGLVITPPELAAAPIPAAWRVGGYVTSFEVAASAAPRVIRAYRPVPAHYYVPPPPPMVVYEAPPPLFLGGPVWVPRWHGGWRGYGWHGR